MPTLKVARTLFGKLKKNETQSIIQQRFKPTLDGSLRIINNLCMFQSNAIYVWHFLVWRNWKWVKHVTYNGEQFPSFYSRSRLLTFFGNFHSFCKLQCMCWSGVLRRDHFLSCLIERKASECSQSLVHFFLLSSEIDV